jgi:hypothetical protein
MRCLTRVLLSLVAPAALATAAVTGWGPASVAVAQSPQADPRALSVLRGALERRYAWPERFPGFTARLTAARSGAGTPGEHSLMVTVSGAGEVAPAAGARPTEPALLWGLTALAEMTRNLVPVPFEAAEGRYPVSFGAPGDHPAGMLLLLNDGAGGTCRIREGRITQRTRDASLPGGERARTIVDYLDHVRDDDGRHLPRSYTVTYLLPGSRRLERCEVVVDAYQRSGGVLLPLGREMAVAADGGTERSLLRIIEPRLLR